MKNIIKTLILLNLALSFDSSFGYFTSNKKENFFKDYFSLSATVNGTENHFLNFVNGSQSAALNFITPSIRYDDQSFIHFEVIGSVNNFTIDQEVFSFDETSYVQGDKYNVNLHYGGTTSDGSSNFSLFAGYESSEVDIYINNWSSIYYNYSKTELSIGLYLIVDFGMGIYGAYLTGENDLLDTYYNYEGWDFGIILPSLFTNNLAWQWSYKMVTYDEYDFDYESNTTQLKMMMDL